MKHDLVYKDPDREFMVISKSMEEKIFQIAHRKGYFGTRKTRGLLKREVYIPNIMSKLDKIGRSYIESIITEAMTGKPEGLLTTIGSTVKDISY